MVFSTEVCLQCEGQIVLFVSVSKGMGLYV